MIRFAPVPCPAEFEDRCRRAGLAWLAEHPDTARPKDFWSPFKSQLATGFGDLCAYSCMHEAVGTVDHYLSTKNHRSLAYDWDNYRFASPWINSSKQTADDAVLDPFLVGDDWFEILLPSLQLVLTSAVPEEHRARAEYTLERLHLRDDERVLRQRRAWYRMYQDKELTLDGLRKKAPLIARAVEKQQRAP
jgi:hypothetical protein